MIVYGAHNRAAFKRQESTLWPVQALARQWITVTSGAPVVVEPPAFVPVSILGLQQAPVSVTALRPGVVDYLRLVGGGRIQLVSGAFLLLQPSRSPTPFQARNASAETYRGTLQ